MMANTSQTLDQLRQLIHKVESGRAQQSEINKFGMGMYQLNPMSVTYKELKELKDNAQLQEFSFYIVEDYQLIHYKGRSSELNISEPEQLLFETLTSDTLKAEARSLTFPEDLVYFDFDGEVAPPSQVPKDDPNFKGYVYRRVDESKNIDVAFDWRHATIRRWKMKDSDAKSIGLPIDTEDIDLYLLPQTLIYTGWKELGKTTNGHHSFGDDHTVDYNKFEAADANDYVDEYFFFNRQTFNDTQNQHGPFKNISIVQCTKPEIDYTSLGNYGDGNQYYHIPNCIFKNRDGWHAEEHEKGEYALSDVTIGIRSFACNTFSITGGFEIKNGWDFSNNIALMMSYGTPFNELGNVSNNLFTGRRGGITGKKGNDEFVNNTILSYLRHRGTVESTFRECKVAVLDGNGDVINRATDGGDSFRENHFYSIEGFTCQMNGAGYLEYNDLKNGNEDILGLHLVIDNTLQHKEVNLSKEKSTFEIEKDVDQSTYTLSLPTEYVGSSWWDQTTTPESEIYGIYRFGDLDGDGTTNIVLKKIDNPPQNFKFQLVPKSGINLVVTHNTDSNGIRLRSADQPDITLNGDNGDFAICDILNGNVTVVDYFQF